MVLKRSCRRTTRSNIEKLRNKESSLRQTIDNFANFGSDHLNAKMTPQGTFVYEPDRILVWLRRDINAQVAWITIVQTPVVATYIQIHGETLGPFSSRKLKNVVEKKVAVNVAGRNKIVTMAITLIEALSRAVARATERESRAISIMSWASWRLSSLSLSIA